MGLLFRFARQLRTWERPSQTAFFIAITLLAIDLIVLVTIPALRDPAVGAAVALMLVAQGIVLWGNRNLVTPYTQAQRLAQRGEMVAARNTLRDWFDELARKDKSRPVDAVVLLGNVERQLVNLEESERLLRLANEHSADYHFALFGLGRTLMVQGQYDEARLAIERALQVGAPALAWHDLAHVAYRMGDKALVGQSLQKAPDDADAARLAMSAMIGQQTDHSWRTTPEQIMAGLPFWEAEAERFAHTAYGQAIEADLRLLRTLADAHSRKI